MSAPDVATLLSLWVPHRYQAAAMAALQRERAAGRVELAGEIEYRHRCEDMAQELVLECYRLRAVAGDAADHIPQARRHGWAYSDSDRLLETLSHLPLEPAL